MEEKELTNLLGVKIAEDPEKKRVREEYDAISSKAINLAFHREDVANKTLIEVLDNEFLVQFQSFETKSAYRRDILKFFNELEVNYLYQIANIYYSDMSKMLNKYIYSHKRTPTKDPNRILNPKTINRKAYSLSSFFNFLVDVYHYPKNPLTRFKAEKVRKTSNTESLSRGEMQEIISFLKKNYTKSKRAYRNYLLICFMFSLALRRNEVANLQWQDIHHQTNPYIEVYQKGRTIKKLPLPIPLYNYLMEYKNNFVEENSEYIFTPTRNNASSDKDTSKPLSTTQINRIVHSVVYEVLPEKNITPHSFRKTFIELALSNNISLVDIMNGTGHASVEMVKYYDSRSSLENNAVNVVYLGII
ncbi:MAG: tyrosine-type recombinase/integrase [Candidatus Sericytochromatia bacterium]